jgi:hypothetical protein
LYKFPNLLLFQTELFLVENFLFDDEDLDNIKEYLLSKKLEGLVIEYNNFENIFHKNALFSQIKPLLKSSISYGEDIVKVRLEILILKIFLHNTENQFQNISNQIGNEKDFQQKQEGFFEYKTKIFHKIINLESKLI